MATEPIRCTTLPPILMPKRSRALIHPHTHAHTHAQRREDKRSGILEPYTSSDFTRTHTHSPYVTGTLTLKQIVNQTYSDYTHPLSPYTKLILTHFYHAPTHTYSDNTPSNIFHLWFHITPTHTSHLPSHLTSTHTLHLSSHLASTHTSHLHSYLT